MSLLDQWMRILQTEMTEPTAWGWFHFICIGIMIFFVIVLYRLKDNHSDKQLSIVLGVYGITAFILELLKQISWSYNLDTTYNIVTWEYSWYSAPFQLCTTPIFVSIICLFLKKSRLRDDLLSYMAFITILGSITTVLLPDSCFVSEILINVHTMWLHLGSLVVSLYIIFSKEIDLSKDNMYGAIKVFIEFVAIAMILNIGVYESDILNGETFDMFYISPYFEKSLPVFSQLYDFLPYYLYLPLYVIILSFGGFIVYLLAKLFRKKVLK